MTAKRTISELTVQINYPALLVYSIDNTDIKRYEQKTGPATQIIMKRDIGACQRWNVNVEEDFISSRNDQASL